MAQHFQTRSLSDRCTAASVNMADAATVLRCMMCADYPWQTAMQVEASTIVMASLSGEYSTAVNSSTGIASFDQLQLHAPNGSVTLVFSAVDHPVNKLTTHAFYAVVMFSWYLAAVVDCSSGECKQKLSSILLTGQTCMRYHVSPQLAPQLY